MERQCVAVYSIFEERFFRASCNSNATAGFLHAIIIRQLPLKHILSYNGGFDGYFVGVLQQIFEASSVFGASPLSLQQNTICFVPKMYDVLNLRSSQPISMPTVDYWVISGILLEQMRPHFYRLLPEGRACLFWKSRRHSPSQEIPYPHFSITQWCHARVHYQRYLLHTCHKSSPLRLLEHLIDRGNDLAYACDIILLIRSDEQFELNNLFCLHCKVEEYICEKNRKQIHNEQINMLIYLLGDEVDDIFLSFRLSNVCASKYSVGLDKFNQYFIGIRDPNSINVPKKRGGRIRKYICELFVLAERCNFGQLKRELIRDNLQLVFKNYFFQKRLQLIPDLAMDKAIEIARQIEAVRMQQKTFGEDSLGNTNINFVKSKTREKSILITSSRKKLESQVSVETFIKQEKLKKLKDHFIKQCQTKLGSQVTTREYNTFLGHFCPNHVSDKIWIDT
ncbi:hypothetical protein LAZ67_13003151 [Cordylochernes scorpioides]|uniref:Uncharacterized protein n=1 Tax=Cordylochernes scorpioides TaxID=51811 RepID=A0ABY6L9W1_9ARAC|nr:hypothetical protein LAZ67_13003151 [Cordylochernes scorpioides]